MPQPFARSSEVLGRRECSKGAREFAQSIKDDAAVVRGEFQWMFHGAAEADLHISLRRFRRFVMRPRSEAEIGS